MKSTKREYGFLLCALVVSLLMCPTGQTSTMDHQPAQYNVAFTPSSNSTREYWPTNGWRNSTPEAEGMNSSILHDMIDYIETQDYPIDSVLIIKNGYIVFEDYPGYYGPYNRHELHSVTKSFTSTLIGIAIQQGLIKSVKEKVLDFFPEYTVQNPDPRKEMITIENLLTMSGGFEWDESTLPYTDPNVNDIGGIIASDDGVQYVLDKPMLYNPGEHWHYSGGSSLLLGAIVQQVAGMTTRNFAYEYLFNPLGFDGASWFQVPGGWYNTFGGQLRITPRDMAKLGFLYLNDGVWNGTQILPEDYSHNATQAYYTNLPFPPDYAGYGWQWWLLPDMKTYAALGRAGQKIIVSSEQDLIVVFTASLADDEYDPEFDLLYEYILDPLDITDGDSLTDPIIVGTILCAVGVALAVMIVYVFKKRNRSNLS